MTPLDRSKAGCTLATLLLSAPALGQIDRDVDEAALRLALRQGAEELPAIEARWRASFAAGGEDESTFAELFGYAPPGRALDLAYLHAFLYASAGDEADARAAAGYLERMADYREEVPAELRTARIEYASGLPAVPSFFHLADYSEAWAYVAGCRSIDDATRATVEAAIAGSADFVFVFPEWGAHNRAMLRAECLLYAARALPHHANAPRWLEMAEILAADSLDRWEIEDAALYQPIWLLALLRYGGDAACESLTVRYYLRYLLELLTPRGTLPDFGDAWWNGGLGRAYACFEWGAAVLSDPELKWAAARVYAALGPFDPARPGLGRAKLYARLYGHLDPDLEPRAPALASGLVLDDVVGKKIVLRGADDFYLLLNYRDEGDFGLLPRDYLRQTLAVEEEKMHHGHADENAIVLFEHGGSVLLHDAGYRERAPSGPFGAYRADLFHNRLVIRRGAPAEGQSTLEFLRDDGAYRRVRSELYDFVTFDDHGGTDYSRTRVTDDELGTVWDRTLVRPRETDLVVVVDTVEVREAGTFTFSVLWAGQYVRLAGPGWAVLETNAIGVDALPEERGLFLAFPGMREEPERFTLRRHNQDEEVVHHTRSLPCDAGDFVSFVTVLRSQSDRADPKRFARRLRLLPAEPPTRAVALRIETEDGALGTSLHVKADLDLGLMEENVRPRYDPARGSIRAGGVETDADFAIVRRVASDAGHGGEEARWCATHMTRVVVNGHTAFESAPLQMFQVTGRSDVVGRVKWRRWRGTLELD